jgi:hypothetical protein
MKNTATLIKEEFWTLVCEHGFTCDFKTKKLALQWQGDSSMWCEECGS